MLLQRIIVALLGLTAVAVVPAHVSAQGQAEPRPAAERRPFRGIFGSPAAADSPHSLLFNAAVYAAYDDNVAEAISEGGSGSVSSPWLQKSGPYQGANAGLDYTFGLDGVRFDFNGGAGGQVQYYRHEDKSDTRPAAHADLAFNARLTRSLTFRVRQGVDYTSNYNAAMRGWLQTDPGLDVGNVYDPALDLFKMNALQLATTAGFEQRFGKHTSIMGAYQFRTMRQIGNDVPTSTFEDYTTHAGNAGFEYARPITRAATLVLGYSIRMSDGESQTGEPEIMHNVNAGVDYGKALSFSRRTSLQFGTGSAIAVTDSVTNPGEKNSQFRLTGNASLVHELGRTWTTSLGYTRGFRTQNGVDELYFTDAVMASIGGLVTRHLELSANATWSSSTVGDSDSKNQRDQSASARATYGLTRFFALYAQYIYYYYRYDDTVALDGRIPRYLDRHGVRAGLTTSVPLLR